MFKLLLDAGGDVSVQDQYGILPLMFAAEHGREVMAKLILKSCKHNSKLQSTLVQQQTNMLATALHFACQNKYPSIRDAQELIHWPRITLDERQSSCKSIDLLALLQH